MRCPAPCSSLVHQQALREDGECPVWIVLSVSQKEFAFNSYMVSIPPFSLGTASGEFLRPAASCLLLFRFLPKALREQQRRLYVPLPKCRPSPWEQTPLAFKCPNYKGKGDSTNVRESRRTNGLFGKEPGKQIHEENGTNARHPFPRHQDLVEGQGRTAAGKNRVASHHRLEWPRGIRGGQTEEGRPPVCRRNPREQCLRKGDRQREEQIQS